MSVGLFDYTNTTDYSLPGSIPNAGVDTSTAPVVINGDTSQIVFPTANGGYSPGSDPNGVPTSDPYSSNPFSILQTVGNTVAAGVNAYTGFLTAKNNISNSLAMQSLNQQKTQAQIDLTRSQINAQATTDQARIAAQTASANRSFANMPGLSSLFGGSGTSSSEYMMLLLSAIGVYFAWRAVKHA